MIPRAIFNYRCYKHIVVIEDQHSETNCSKSVTNDIEYVIDVVSANLHGLKGMRVIYRDTDKRYDEVLIRDNKFYDFASINTESLATALQFIIKTKGK